MQDLIARAFPYLEDLLDDQRGYQQAAEKDGLSDAVEDHQETIDDLADLIARMREAIGDVVGDDDKEPALSPTPRFDGQPAWVALAYEDNQQGGWPYEMVSDDGWFWVATEVSREMSCEYNYGLHEETYGVVLYQNAQGFVTGVELTRKEFAQWFEEQDYDLSEE